VSAGGALETPVVAGCNTTRTDCLPPDSSPKRSRWPELLIDRNTRWRLQTISTVETGEFPMWWRTLSVYFGSCRCRGRNHVDNWVREKALVPASKRTWRRRYDAKGAAARSNGRLVKATGYVSFCLPAQSAPIHPIIDCSLDLGSR
jgi:hypothetical protein